MGLRRVYNVIMNRLAFIRDKTTHLKPSSPKVIDIKQNTVVKNYINELHNAIISKDSYIVALSGDYGTGKSSIIKTYKENYVLCKNNHIIISSSTFLKYKLKDTVVSKNNEIDINELELVKRIEESILQQIIYRHNNREMEDSEIKRLNNDKRLIRILSFLYLVLYILLITIFFSNTELCTFIQDSYIRYFSFIFNFKYFDYLVIGNNIIISLIILYNMYRFLRYVFYTKKISKVKFETTEVEVKTLNSLPFGKNLFEIIYFFSKSKVKVVFIEDLDRFSPDVTRLVMEELKEINRVVNGSKFVKHKVTFVYELRDCVFKDYKQKNKFYDYNISIMPLSTSTNSLFHISSILNDFNENYALDDQLLRTITKYITDYRTLVNIVNTFVLYIRNTEITIPERNKLFAIVAYKNYYLESDAELFAINSKLRKSIKTITTKRDGKLKRYQTALINLNMLSDTKDYNENLTIKEFLYNYFLSKDESGNIYRKDKALESKDNFFEISHIEIDDYNLIHEEERDVLKEIVVLYDEFAEEKINRIKFILTKHINNLTLSHPNILNFGLNEIKKDNVDLKYELIFSNYIDDYYIDYLTALIINDDFDINDNKYMLRVAHNLDASDIPIEEKHMYSVIKCVTYNETSSILNKSMLSHYYELKNMHQNTTYINNFFNRMLSEFQTLDEKNLKFIDKFLSTNQGSNNSNFLEDLIEKQNFIIELESVVGDNLNTSEQIKNIILELLWNIELKEYKPFIKNIKKYIEDKSFSLKDLRYSYLLYSDKFKQNYIDLDIKVTNVSNYHLTFEDFILENNLYKFNENNHKYYNFQFRDLNTRFYEYFSKNYNDFGNDFYIKDKSFKIGNVDVIKSLFELEGLDSTFKKEIIHRENFILDKFDFEYANEMLKYNHVLPTWKNVNAYIGKASDNQIIKFILENKDELIIKKSILLNARESFKKELLKQLLKEKDIKYVKKYLRNLKGQIKIYPTETYSDNLINELIINDALMYDKRSIKTLLKRPNCKLSYYVDNCYKNKNDAGEFLKLINYNEMLIERLHANKLSDNDRIEILRRLSLKKIDLSIWHEKFLDKRKKYMLKQSVYERVVKEYIDHFAVRKEKGLYVIQYKG